MVFWKRSPGRVLLGIMFQTGLVLLEQRGTPNGCDRKIKRELSLYFPKTSLGKSVQIIPFKAAVKSLPFFSVQLRYVHQLSYHTSPRIPSRSSIFWVRSKSHIYPNFSYLCWWNVHFSLVQSPPLSDPSVGPGASLGAHLASACCHGREGGSCATATEGGGWGDGGPAQLDTQWSGKSP